MPQADRRGLSLFGPPSALVARAFGVACIAVGFVLGIEALASPESAWLRTSLALIVTGLLAQVYGMYVTVKHRRAREAGEGGSGEENGKRKSGIDDGPGPG